MILPSALVKSQSVAVVVLVVDCVNKPGGPGPVATALHGDSVAAMATASASYWGKLMMSHNFNNRLRYIIPIACTLLRASLEEEIKTVLERRYLYQIVFLLSVNEFR